VAWPFAEFDEIGYWSEIKLEIVHVVSHPFVNTISLI
jgi:hypothetical protein